MDIEDSTNIEKRLVGAQFDQIRVNIIVRTATVCEEGAALTAYPGQVDWRRNKV